MLLFYDLQGGDDAMCLAGGVVVFVLARNGVCCGGGGGGGVASGMFIGCRESALRWVAVVGWWCVFIN